ncbi:hypothetical protein LF1_01050 [Rubripirellula obstinata]|uniref:PKD domain-containing protein n=1 Tax=Rubripirellula obstinata TaxID=406547 RepID=A0A5B1C916_9BACT|nr:dockerin type I domain-containing protein [Rubripirellula obstinata]KAA1257617.1 hypothetical protein LF1_01050 [Rubripirellula obstinata]
MPSHNTARDQRAWRIRRPKPSRHRTAHRSRRLSIQSLETRRLMVAENAVFEISEVLSAAGLVGNVSSQVQWGDGSLTNATTTGGSATGNLNVRFNYSLDDNRFFNRPGARAALEFAAESFVSRFSDQFTAIGTNQYVTVIPKVLDPVTGNEVVLPSNPSIAANEIVIYPGSRNFTGNTAGVGGPGAFDLPSSFTFRTPAERARIQAEISAFRNSVVGRGQAGALGTATTATDYAVAVGSIAFDQRSSRDWYFGIDPDGIGPGQSDFITIATHELAHVFGFGLSNSWARLSSANGFRGAAAKAIFPGSGNVPLESHAGEGFAHWADNVDEIVPTIMPGTIDGSRRASFSPLDFAAMDDIGFDVVNMDATVTASHRYPDDGSYPTKIILKGSRGGVVEYELGNTTVTNVAPTLSVVEDRTVTEGQSFSITNIGSITDPGFRNQNVDPSTTETFSYTIDWGDGESDSGTATIDRHGNASPRTTNASFNGSHRYDSPGNKTVRVTVTDDDGGRDTETFRITVNPIPELSLAFADATITENAGNNATTLTVSVSGPASDQPRRVNLVSSDSTEVTVPATATIPANATSVVVPVNAIDDDLFDGNQISTVTASGTGVESATAEITVGDAETISAAFSATTVVEGSSGEVTLTLTRSNTDTDEALEVLLRRNRGRLGLPASVEIPAGQRTLDVALNPPNDDMAELTTEEEVLVLATGYPNAVVSLNLVDDEPPLFQNPDNRFDVDGVDGVSVLDALIVINVVARRLSGQLDPATETPDGQFWDVNGDYQVTALDALQTINFIARNAGTQREPEPPPSERMLVVPQSDDGDDESNFVANDDAIASMF